MNQQYGAKSFSQQISLGSIYEPSPPASGLISYRDKLWIRCLRVCYYSPEFILVRNLISQKYFIFSLPKTCAFLMRFFISLVSKASITHYASGWQNWDCFPFCNIIYPFNWQLSFWQKIHLLSNFYYRQQKVISHNSQSWRTYPSWRKKTNLWKLSTRFK